MQPWSRMVSYISYKSHLRNFHKTNFPFISGEERERVRDQQKKHVKQSRLNGILSTWPLQLAENNVERMPY